MKKGFTLIELLVVVLIIGILSSVALPQYTKAVHRARATEAWTIGKSVRTAQDVYFMANNEYASDMEDLDIQIPEMKYWDIEEFSVNGSDYWSLALTGKGAINNMDIRIDGGAGILTNIRCFGEENLCKIMLPCAVPIGSHNGSYCEF